MIPGRKDFFRVFEAVYENKPFIINAYNAVSREQIENFLFQLTHDLIISVVEEQARSTSLTQEQKSFIADFYKYSFVGIMLDWIRQGMKSDYTDIWKNMCHYTPRKYHKFHSVTLQNMPNDKFLLIPYFCKLNSNANGNTIRDRKGKLHNHHKQMKGGFYMSKKD